jgi:hypothetical protein
VPAWTPGWRALSYQMTLKFSGCALTFFVEGCRPLADWLRTGTWPGTSRMRIHTL